MSGTLGTAATNPRAASGSGWTPRLVLSLVSIALVDGRGRHDAHR